MEVVNLQVRDCSKVPGITVWSATSNEQWPVTLAIRTNHSLFQAAQVKHCAIVIVCMTARFCFDSSRFDMASVREQRICVKFCSKLGKTAAETR